MNLFAKIIWNITNKDCDWIQWIQWCMKSQIISIMAMVSILCLFDTIISHDLVCYGWRSWNILVVIRFDFVKNWRNRVFLFCIDLYLYSVQIMCYSVLFDFINSSILVIANWLGSIWFDLYLVILLF